MSYLSSEELMAARKRMALTRRKVAAALGVTEGTLYNWENGVKKIPPLKMQGIISALEDLEAQL
jgi:DNA-binding transcriptional regulator YiaG